MLETVFHTIQNNQTLLAALGLGGAGILTFWVKDVPKKIFALLKRELTTSLTVTSHNITFYHILQWVGNNYKNKNFRELKLTNGKWGEEEVSTLSVGYGVHFIRFEKFWFLLRLIKEEANQTLHDKETLVLTRLGRSKDPFLRFIKVASAAMKDDKKTKIYKFEDDWEFVKEQNKRDFSTVFLNPEVKNELLIGLEKFIKKETWYEARGIPYQLGILLYGPPGTGKTTLIRAIASYFDYPLYIISTSRMLKIEKAFETIPEKCIVVIEDIDCQMLTHTRDSLQDETSRVSVIPKKDDTFAMIGLAEVLNALDGVCSVNGRILIATTNKIEKLDPALIRSGRFDIKTKIDYVDKETFTCFLKAYYPDYFLKLNELTLKNNVTVAQLQEYALKEYTPEEIIKYVTG